MSRKQPKTVGVGTRVTFRNVGTEEVSSYVLTSSLKADPAAGIISIACPLARGIEGCRVGDKPSVELTEGFIIVEILDVKAAKE
ncbi:MAG: GreA/GreB family elongation factor [Elusimicrobiota bacterium]